MTTGPWLNQDHTLGLDHSHPKVSALRPAVDGRWDSTSCEGLPAADPSCPPLLLFTFAQTNLATSAILQRKACPRWCFLPGTLPSTERQVVRRGLIDLCAALLREAGLDSSSRASSSWEAL